MEYELLGEIQRFRNELKELLGFLDVDTEEVGRRGFCERPQGSRTGLVAVREELAAIIAKQEKCGCKCCTEGVHAHLNLQVSHHPVSIVSPSTDPREGEA